MSNPTQPSAEILPCPFCNGDDLVYREDITEDEPHMNYAWHVFCQDCHCHGRNNFPIGWCESKDAALEAWNLRGARRHSDLDDARPDQAVIETLVEALEKWMEFAELINSGLNPPTPSSLYNPSPSHVKKRLDECVMITNALVKARAGGR